MYTLGDRISSIRKSKRITQSQLSSEILNRVTISNIENNKQEPSISQLIHICNVLNIDINSLFYEKLTLKSNINEINVIENLYATSNYYDIIKYFELDRTNFNKLNSDCKFFYLGVSYFKNNLLKESKKYLTKYINLYLKYDEQSQDKNIANFCYSLNYLFKIDYVNNKVGSIKFLELAFNFISKYRIELEEISLIILSNMCHYYLENKSYNQIIEKCRYFHNICFKICYPEIYINIFKSLTLAYINCNKYTLAIYYSQKVINLYAYLDDDHKQGYAYINYINAYRFNEDFEQALVTLRYIKSKFNDDLSLKNIYLSEEVNIYFNMKHFNEALLISSTIKVSMLTRYGQTAFNLMNSFLNIITKCKPVSESTLLKFEKFLERNCITYDLFALYGCLYYITSNNLYIQKKNSLTFSRVEKNIFISLDEAKNFLDMINSN